MRGRWIQRAIATGLMLLFAGPLAAGPLDPKRVSADLGPVLSAGQKEAAAALGEALRATESGDLAAVRAALPRIRKTEALAGYADWISVRLLLEEGKSEDAYKTATAAIDGLAPGSGDALRAALGVLQGEALAMSGNQSGAELAWSQIFESPANQDEAVKQSIKLSIVAAQQRRGSLDPKVNPRVLLDETFAETTVGALVPPSAPLKPTEALARAEKALASRHTSRAIELFDQALAGKLSSAQKLTARMGRAHALFTNREYEASEKAFRALRPDPEARFWHARSLARLDRIPASIKAFEALGEEDEEEWASWALYLVGTLYEGRDQLPNAIAAYKRASGFEAFPDRARSALWRQGWAEFRSGEDKAARKTLTALAEQTGNPIAQLRPRYWAARAAWRAGDKAAGKKTLESIAQEYPLTYYGWRAQERLTPGKTRVIGTKGKLVAGTRGVDDRATLRAALLIEAGLDELARAELRHAATVARGLSDRVQLGALMAKVGDYHRANELVLNAYSDSLARGLQEGQEALWWLSWPPAYRELIDAHLPKGANIDPELVWAIMREESHYQVEARSSVGALGLLQLMPATAEQLAQERGLLAFKEEQLFDPAVNIQLGAAYLVKLGARFPGRPSAAIGSYNAGPRKVASWLEGANAELEDDIWVESIPYDQTRAYVKRVLRSLHAYKSFYR